MGLGQKLNKEEYLDIDYVAGRCHLFAVIAAEYLGLDVILLWDDEAYGDDMKIIPEPCLVHAYVELKGEVFDIEGLRDVSIQNVYPVNSPRKESKSIADVMVIANDRGWPMLNSNERILLVSKVKRLLS